MENEVLSGGAYGIAGFAIAMAFKFMERTMGKLGYTQDARAFLSDHAEKLESINKAMAAQTAAVASQYEVMQELKEYAKQNAENAMRMSMILDQMFRKRDG